MVSRLNRVMRGETGGKNGRGEERGPSEHPAEMAGYYRNWRLGAGKQSLGLERVSVAVLASFWTLQQIQLRWGPSLRGGKCTQAPTPTKTLSVIDNHRTGKKKIRVLQWTLMGYVNHASGQAPCQEAVGQHKMSSIVFLKTFCLILLCWGICCLIGLLLPCFFFSLLGRCVCFHLFVCLFVLKKTNIKLGRWEGLEGNCGT